MLIAPGRCEAAKEIGGSASTSTSVVAALERRTELVAVDGLHQTTNAWRQRRMMSHWMRTMKSVTANIVTVAAAA